MLRLGLHSGSRTHSLFLGPGCQPQRGLQAIDFLGMVLPPATRSQNQPSKTCSQLGARLQLARTTTDRPETLAYPLQPYPHFRHWQEEQLPLAWGELILPFLLRLRARRGAPTPLSGTQTQTLCHQPSPHNSCLGSAPFITVIKQPSPPYHLMLWPLSPAMGETVTPKVPIESKLRSV